MDMLQSVLECCNPYVDVYQQAFNLSENTTLPEYHIQLDFRKGSNRCQYNLPTALEELAMLIPGDKNALANAQDIII